MATGTELVKVSMDDYALMQMDAEVLIENLAGESINASDLPKIKLPTGGGKFFVLPGSEDAVRSFDAVILYSQRTKAYWQDSTPSAGTPPNCSAYFDMGTMKWVSSGEPGGNCDTCPFNEFGSAIGDNGKVGRGKACGETRFMVLATEKSSLPVILRAPAGSLKAMKQYMLNLPVKYSSVVTRFALESEKNEAGIEYARLSPVCVGIINAEDRVRITQMMGTLRVLFEALATNPAPIETGAFEEDEIPA